MLNPLPGVLGIIFGAVAIQRINEKPQELEGGGMAKAGIICGIISVVAFAVVLVVIISISGSTKQPPQY